MNPSKLTRKDLMALYGSMRSRFGFLDWWPGDSADEVFIGAILTQNTSWKNVEKAIANLSDYGLLGVSQIADASLSRIEKAIRPSGYYKQKALRLKSICSGIMHNYGSLGSLFSIKMPKLRETLLSMNGIGPETADSIILYAAEKPTFVIDAYTRRIMNRVFGTSPEIGYESLKLCFESKLKRDITLFNDYHAQFVELGKNYCRSRPICNGCPVNSMCRYANSG